VCAHLDQLLPERQYPVWLRPPEPTAGGERDDGVRLLYTKRMHTVIGLTTCGKTTFALWPIKAALDAGEHVIYLHFEETDPGVVLERCKALE
jgi:hypothetical protein